MKLRNDFKSDLFWDSENKCWVADEPSIFTLDHILKQPIEIYAKSVFGSSTQYFKKTISFEMNADEPTAKIGFENVKPYNLPKEIIEHDGLITTKPDPEIEKKELLEKQFQHVFSKKYDAWFKVGNDDLLDFLSPGDLIRSRFIEDGKCLYTPNAYYNMIDENNNFVFMFATAGEKSVEHAESRYEQEIIINGMKYHPSQKTILDLLILPKDASLAETTRCLLQAKTAEDECHVFAVIFQQVFYEILNFVAENDTFKSFKTDKDQVMNLVCGLTCNSMQFACPTCTVDAMHWKKENGILSFKIEYEVDGFGQNSFEFSVPSESLNEK